jgi:hypothetical protein
VSFRDGQATGKVIDLEFNDTGGIATVVVRSNDELVSVPWSEARFIVPARQTIRNRSATLEREPAVVPEAPVVREQTTREVTTVVRPRVVVIEPRSGDPYDDYLFARFGYRTTPGWRIADLLKDRFEARRAPPLSLRARPAVYELPLHSSIR